MNLLVWVNLLAMYEIMDFEVSQLITASDHFPICVTLERKEKLFQSSNKLKWRNDLANKYFNEMNSVSCIALTNHQDIDFLGEELINLIISKTKVIGKTSKLNNKSGLSKPWYDNECLLLKKTLKKLLNKCKKENFANNQTIVEYDNTKKLYYNKQKLKKETHRNAILEQLMLCKDSKTFWGIITGFRYKCNKKNDINLDSWHEYFSIFFKQNESHTEQNIINRISSKDSNAKLETIITRDEIIFAMRNSKNNKSPGPDEISFEFLKNLPENWINYMTLLFNKILNEEKIPKTWSKINFKMIYKKGDVNDPCNYRLIALVSTIYLF